MVNWKDFSQIFYNFLAGIGTFLAGLGALVILYKWSKNLSNKRWFEYVKSTYSLQNQDKTFVLIRFHEHNGRIYIYDVTMRTRYWINNGPTLTELGYKYESWVEVQNENNLDAVVLGKKFKEYKDYKDGRIVTVVDPYQI